VALLTGDLARRTALLHRPALAGAMGERAVLASTDVT
jgi:hypothetical protein